ncbi:uncharacterized protein TRUGW13939_09389 [Talaromyces rugulosus]|uniref:Uncharacterized protein n=1 Tax=Talaromyces rugulosus TaxID=121627 RepID=A0A7H8R792_TALRU|nr:uncharacterized protein TRUGW13939_09389 [Talaromyces rugulosus]QKX62230.1 hypothetical protein TRUGW13939_09389 [Talaromyces rugulosus]
MSDKKLAGQVALITGAGGGFGESFARRFVGEGAQVVIAEINTSAGKRVEQDLKSTYGDNILFITEGLASEYGPDGIRVNSICPLLGYTGLTETFTGVKDTPEFRAKFAATIPMRRGLEHDDLANAAVYLCSSDSSFVTGVNLPVDGGSTTVVD